MRWRLSDEDGNTWRVKQGGEGGVTESALSGQFYCLLLQQTWLHRQTHTAGGGVGSNDHIVATLSHTRALGRHCPVHQWRVKPPISAGSASFPPDVSAGTCAPTAIFSRGRRDPTFPPTLRSPQYHYARDRRLSARQLPRTSSLAHAQGVGSIPRHKTRSNKPTDRRMQKLPSSHVKPRDRNTSHLTGPLFRASSLPFSFPKQDKIYQSMLYFHIKKP